MLRRPGQSEASETKEESNEKEALLDEDEQEKKVRKLVEEAAVLTRRFQKFFTVVVVFAILVALAYPFLCESECIFQWETCLIHSIYSAGNHGAIIFITRGDALKQSSNNQGIVSLITVAPLLLWIFGMLQDEVEYFHIGLIVGNVVTFFGSLLILWDAQSTQRALEALDAAKYRYKSL